MRQCDNRAEITAVAQIDRVGIRFGRGEVSDSLNKKRMITIRFALILTDADRQSCIGRCSQCRFL